MNNKPLKQKRGTKLNQIRRLARRHDGMVQASQLVKLGWTWQDAVERLHDLFSNGRAKKLEPTGLPGMKWEPIYQIDLKFL